MKGKVPEETKEEIIKDIEKDNKVPEKVAVAEEALDEKAQLKKEKKAPLEKSGKSKGKVIQFRRGRKTIKERHFLLDLGAKTRKDAENLVGKKVEWKSPAGKIIKGKVSSPHGGKGLVRAIFEKGLPGQAVTTEVEVK